MTHKFFAFTIIFIFIIIGYVSQVLQKPSIIEYYVFFYLAIMSVIWFHYEVYRYLMPIVPFLVFSIFLRRHFA